MLNKCSVSIKTHLCARNVIRMKKARASIIPSKTFSRNLLNFSYKKPLFSLVFFVVGLITVVLIIQALRSISVPLVGSATVTLPYSLTQGLRANLFLSAGFQWPSWVGVIAASLCIAAKLYHKRIEKKRVVHSQAREHHWEMLISVTRERS
jgi:cytochrome b561